MQENSALRNLNMSLKTESDTKSAEIEQLRQQLTQNGIEPQTPAPTSEVAQDSEEPAPTTRNRPPRVSCWKLQLFEI